jgi:hypothetical protein
VLTGALLTFFSLLGLAITAMISMNFYAQPVAPFMAVVFGLVAAVSLYLTVWYLSLRFNCAGGKGCGGLWVGA